MINRILFCVSVLFVFSTCRKEKFEETKFRVTTTFENNIITLKWDPVLINGFKNIQVYRSTRSIPDPSLNHPIDASLLLKTFGESSSTGMKDSIISFSAEGMVYYKVVVNFKDRFQVSDEQSISINATSIPIPSQFSGSSMIAFPSQNLLYIYSSYEVCVIDYHERKVLSVKNIPTNYNGMSLYPVVNNGKPELFIGHNTFIACYDARTLEVKYGMTIYPGMREFCVKDERLYTLSYGYTIKTYDLNSLSFVSEKAIPFKSGKQAANLFFGRDLDRIYVKYHTQYTHNQSGYYVNKSYIFYYNLINGLPADSAHLDIPELNKDTLTYADYSRIVISPCGNYISCNRNGDIYSVPEHKIYNVKTNIHPDPFVQFASDGKHAVVKQYNPANAYYLALFRVPGFMNEKVLKSPNGMSTSSGQIDFCDGDSLISCNTSNGRVNIFINRIE